MSLVCLGHFDIRISDLPFDLAPFGRELKVERLRVEDRVVSLSNHFGFRNSYFVLPHLIIVAERLDRL